MTLILYLSFEELTALGSSAEQVLVANEASGHGIAAPPQLLAEVELFNQRLTGDISVANLDDQRTLQLVVKYLLARSLATLDETIVMQHAAAEGAVAAYFDYAHILTVHNRLQAMGDEMAALVNLMTGEDPDSESGRRFSFPE